MRRLPGLLRPSPHHGLGPAHGSARGVRLVLVKASKYDDDGAVFAFRWGVIPCHTLIVLAGIADAWAAMRPEIELQTVLWDEVVDGAVDATTVAEIVASAKRDRVTLIVGLAAVQTNQYPRARDLALQFRGAGATVVMGGFHVSSHAPSRAFLASVGVTSVVGETETSLPRLLDDAVGGTIAALYRVESGLRARTGLGEIDVPAIERTATPAVSTRYLRSFLNPTFSSIDTSRGCPFVCSFCSVKNVMGRTMRSRDPAAVIAWVRDVYDRHGIRTLLVVDDDFYRNPRWRDILAGLRTVRRERPDLSFLMQVDVRASLDGSDFVEQAAAAGCFQVFVGLESLEPRNLTAIAKVQNHGGGTAVDHDAIRERYARAIDAWHAAGVAFHAGYIVGLPHDTAGCGGRAARDLAAIGVDLASFFVWTPFPGTEDHATQASARNLIDDDFDRYDSTHVVIRHPYLGTDELTREYRSAYRTFYSWRRLAWCLATGHRVPGLGPAARAGMVSHTVYYTYSDRRGWHPMLGGVWRRRRTVQREVISDDDAVRRYLGSST
jgi:radical SAM superfamily enzyme YgiQ (UPF0313 family)